MTMNSKKRRSQKKSEQKAKTNPTKFTVETNGTENTVKESENVATGMAENRAEIVDKLPEANDSQVELSIKSASRWTATELGVFNAEILTVGTLDNYYGPCEDWMAEFCGTYFGAHDAELAWSSVVGALDNFDRSFDAPIPFDSGFYKALSKVLRGKLGKNPRKMLLRRQCGTVSYAEEDSGSSQHEDSQTSLYHSTSQNIQDDELFLAGREPLIENLLHSFLDAAFSITNSNHGRSEWIAKVDPSHWTFRRGYGKFGLSTTNDGSIVAMAFAPNGRLCSLENLPPLATLEAKPKGDEVPAQHAAELIALVLARVEEFGDTESQSWETIAEGMTEVQRTACGVVMCGTKVFFTKTVLSPAYIKFLQSEGESEDPAVLRIHSTSSLDLIVTQERVQAGILACTLGSTIQDQWDMHVRSWL